MILIVGYHLIYLNDRGRSMMDSNFGNIFGMSYRWFEPKMDLNGEKKGF